MTQEIAGIMERMTKNVIFIDQNNFPQKVKDDSKNIWRESIDYLLEQTSPQKINQEIMNEYRRKSTLK